MSLTFAPEWTLIHGTIVEGYGMASEPLKDFPFKDKPRGEYLVAKDRCSLRPA